MNNSKLTAEQKQIHAMLLDMDVILDATLALDMGLTNLREQSNDEQTLKEIQVIINLINHKVGKWVRYKR